MDSYRLWYVKRDGRIQGPFPEALVCRFIVLGRMVGGDDVSLDGSFWRKVGEVHELADGVRHLLEAAAEDAAADPEWGAERSKAVLRWLDDRKSPDPRARQPQPAIAANRERRSGAERRRNPETVEQQVYREWRGEFEAWIRQRKHRYGVTAAVVAVAALAALLVSLTSRPVNPVKIGLVLHSSDCAAAPARGVNWSDCLKDDAILAGADLQGADLIGTRMRRANLRYADLSRANLTRADLAGADLAGARLDHAVWVDGRICAAGSVGRCQ